jgi:hypothetical protein
MYISHFHLANNSRKPSLILQPETEVLCVLCVLNHERVISIFVMATTDFPTQRPCLCGFELSGGVRVQFECVTLR